MSALCTSAIIKYFPRYIARMARRASYYLMGREGDERLLWQWISQLYHDHATPAAGGAAVLQEL